MVPSQPAASALACMQCFKSKCKCVSRSDGNGCERCHRLKKHCRPSDPLRKSANEQRRHDSKARIRELQDKVDSLLKLYSLVAQSPTSSATLSNALHDNAALAGYDQLLPKNDADCTSNAADVLTGNEHGAATQVSSENASPTASMSSHVAATTGDSLANNTLPFNYCSMHDAENCFAIFRDRMLPSFSFISVPTATTAQQLQRDRPFLMRAIIAVASSTKRQKLAFGTELKQILAQTKLVQNQSSIDLLLGLLVFTAWSHDQIFNPSCALSRLILLAMSLACDLRLDKPLPPEEHMMKPMVDDSSPECHHASKHWFVAEEQRAVLACYALSSMVSIYFAQIDAMKWKPRMEESLRALEANVACPADVAFAFQVRLQLLAQKAVQVREQREWDSIRTSFQSSPALSANLYIRSLEQQLHQLAQSLPPALKQQSTLRMHVKYLELCMYEMARTAYSDAGQKPTSTCGGSNETDDMSTSGGNTLGFDRVDFSCRSVAAIKAWMDIFFSLSPAECAGLSFLHMAQIARCLMVLYRLSTFVDPSWDCQLVRGTVDLLSVLNGVAEKLEMASGEAGEQSHDDLFMYLSSMMRKFRANAAVDLNRKTTAAEDNGWLNSAKAAAPSDREAARIQSQSLWNPMNSNDDLFMDNIFRDFGGVWSA